MTLRTCCSALTSRYSRLGPCSWEKCPPLSWVSAASVRTGSASQESGSLTPRLVPGALFQRAQVGCGLCSTTCWAEARVLAEASPGLTHSWQTSASPQWTWTCSALGAAGEPPPGGAVAWWGTWRGCLWRSARPEVGFLLVPQLLPTKARTRSGVRRDQQGSGAPTLSQPQLPHHPRHVPSSLWECQGDAGFDL